MTIALANEKHLEDQQTDADKQAAPPRLPSRPKRDLGAAAVEAGPATRVPRTSSVPMLGALVVGSSLLAWLCLLVVGAAPQQAVSLSDRSFANHSTPGHPPQADRRQASSTSVSAFTAPAEFPKSAFTSYYDFPTATEKQPRPIITDARANAAFPPSLDRPYPLPTGSPETDAVFPDRTAPRVPASFAQAITANITALLTTPSSASNCTRCVESLKLGQRLARADPTSVPDVLVELCTRFNYTSTKSGRSQRDVCRRTYAAASLGAQYAQILSYANLEGEMPRDGVSLCHYTYTGAACAAPEPLDLGEDFLRAWFGDDDASQRRRHQEDESKYRRRRAQRRHAGEAFLDRRSGRPRMLRVLHMSDLHLDPRYDVGSEAQCTSGQCCRSDSFNKTLAPGPPPTPPNSSSSSISSSSSSLVPHWDASHTSLAAPYFGGFQCDVPWSLAMSALESIRPLNDGQDVDLTLFTGDMVTHDAVEHVSIDLVRYTQQAVFDTMKKYLGKGPVFSALGNHDSAPSDFASANAVPAGNTTAGNGTADENGTGGGDGKRPKNFNWDYDNVARLFEAEGWFTHREAQQVGLHYAGYSVSPRKGLRVIALNTDHWYKNNPWNFVNSSQVDFSGNLGFLTRQLAEAQRRDERVWIVGHVLTGWDGSNALPDPTNLFRRIVERYAHVVAFIAWGHTHEDFFNVFYANNATRPRASDANAVAFVGPSVTPLTNVNPAIRIYTVDPETYEIHDIDTWYASTSSFASLAPRQGVTWSHLYSAREAYSNLSVSASTGSYSGGVALDEGGTTWPRDAPLNATFWAAWVDEAEARLNASSAPTQGAPPTPLPASSTELLDLFRRRQGRASERTKLCSELGGNNVTKARSCYEAQLCYMRSASASLGQRCTQGYGSVQS